MTDQQRVHQAEEAQFVENVQRLRELKGWSQGELARRMADAGWDGFHQTTISRIEKGQRPVRLAEARALAQVLESQVGTMIAPPPEAAILESLSHNMGMMRLARKRIWAQLEELNDHKLNLKMLVDEVDRIPQEHWERLGLWEAVTQMVVQASHMQNWSPASIIGEVMGGPNGVDPEEG